MPTVKVEADGQNNGGFYSAKKHNDLGYEVAGEYIVRLNPGDIISSVRTVQSGTEAWPENQSESCVIVKIRKSDDKNMINAPFTIEYQNAPKLVSAQMYFTGHVNADGTSNSSDYTSGKQTNARGQPLTGKYWVDFYSQETYWNIHATDFSKTAYPYNQTEIGFDVDIKYTGSGVLVDGAFEWNYGQGGANKGGGKA